MIVKPNFWIIGGRITHLYLSSPLLLNRNPSTSLAFPFLRLYVRSYNITSNCSYRRHDSTQLSQALSLRSPRIDKR